MKAKWQTQVMKEWIVCYPQQRKTHNKLILKVLLLMVISLVIYWYFTDSSNTTKSTPTLIVISQPKATVINKKPVDKPTKNNYQTKPIFENLDEISQTYQKNK